MIETYNILFGVNFRHTYYRDGRCKAISVKPDNTSYELIKKYGLVYREKPDGFIILAECDKIDSESMLSKKIEKDLQFNFLLAFNNPYFPNITELPSIESESFQFFSNGLVDLNEKVFIFQSGHSIQMTADSFISDHSVSNGIFGVISIDLNSENILDNDNKMLSPIYNLQLKAKETFWQYTLNIKQNPKNLVIESKGGAEEFNQSEPGNSANMPVIVFTSKEQIAITESRDDYFRLILRNGDPANDLILISKLPIPGISILNQKKEGKIYTPIYVNF